MIRNILLPGIVAILHASCAYHPDQELTSTISERDKSPIIYHWSEEGEPVASLAVSWIDDDDVKNEPMHGEITKMLFSTHNTKVDIPPLVFSEWWWPNLDELTLRRIGDDGFKIELYGGDGSGAYNAYIEIHGGEVTDFHPKRASDPKPW